MQRMCNIHDDRHVFLIMRSIFVLSFLIIGLVAFSQSDKVKFEKYLEKYTDGKQLSKDSWMITLEEDTVSLSEYSGKWVLIDYWSVTCRPCIKEFPALNQYTKEHGIEDLEVIAISVDEDMDRWLKLSPKRNLSFPSYYVTRSIENDLFGLNLSLVQDGAVYNLSTTLPRYALVGPDGVIVENEILHKPSDSQFAKYISSLMK